MICLAALSAYTIASFCTAAGTLVLALATFSAIRSSNRYARVAERSLLASQRPVLTPSRDDDPVERVRFGDGYTLEVHGHGCAFELGDEGLYMAIGIRNGGNGLAVIHAWRPEVRPGMHPEDTAPALEDFRRQSRDLFIPADYPGFWQGAIRDTDDADYKSLHDAYESGDRVVVDLLYGDAEGGQRTIARFTVSSRNGVDGEHPRADVVRYWYVDAADPR